MKCECDRERDVLDAVAAGRWPDRCDEDLRTHASGCGICSDLADVAGALEADQDVVWREARVPAAGVVWWRAQLRAREDAARAAGRPVAFIQGVAASVAVWLVIALFRAVPSDSIADWRSTLGGFFPDITVATAGISRMTPAVPIIVFVIVVASLLLVPIAVYLAVADE